MKKILFITIAVLFFGSQEIFAKGIPIPVGTAEHIKMTADLPNTDDYKGNTGNYLDLGVLYETFEIVWMPVWVTKQPRIVGVEGEGSDMYYDLTPEQLAEVLEANNLKEEDVLKVSFWSKYTGLLVLAPIVIFGIIGFFSKDEEEA